MTSRSIFEAGLKHRLSAVQSHEDAMRFWCEHRSELAGYTFVLAEPEGPGALHFPARIDFQGSGYLRSVFAYDNLFVINNDLLDCTLVHGQSLIRVNYTIAFDANVASYLRAWHRGHPGPMVKLLQSVFRALNDGHFNWDLLPFLLERSEDILAGRDLDQIYETQLAVMWFADSDRAHFAQTSKIRLRTSESEISRRAQTALAEWDRRLRMGMNDFIQERFHLFHAAILKIVLLQLENPRPNAVALKMERWLEFMHNDLRMLLILPTRAALDFFQKGGAFKPMAKVAASSPSLCKYARNVAWDFVQLIWRHTFTGFHSRMEGIFIPYFLTFDRGLVELHDLYLQESCLFGNEINPPQFFAMMDLPALILSSCPELKPVVSRIFSQDADSDRQSRRSSSPAQNATIAAELERELAGHEIR